ncbi:SMP-30/gluconolactonase/LRE family protein (plasmid) [Haloferacaceae archaeon DSL9]
MVQLDRVADTHAHTGEGPLWHPDEERLYWVDIPAGRLYQYDPVSDEYGLAYETDNVPIGGFTLEEDGALLLFTHRTVSRFVPGSEDAEPICEIDAKTRFNDVIADPEGRVFCGTMPGENGLGDLYRLDPDGTATIAVEDVDIPNGMGFSRNLETFYFTESEAQEIYAFDYEQLTGEISNKRTFAAIPVEDGVPDGMTVDEDDYIWSARWDGGTAVRYDPSGAPTAEIDLPARKVSSVAFGGREYRDLYLTTALTDEERSTEGPGAGALFRVSNVETGGVPEFRSRIAGE